MAQQQVQQQAQQRTTKRATEAADTPPTVQEKNDRLKAEMDAILDDIEGVLVENAETFLAAYIQRGGE